MADSQVSFDTTGVEKMIRMLDTLGKSPQKAVNRAASKAGTILKRAIRQGTVPVGETGNLKKSIIKVPEHSRKRGKKVYQATFDRAYNDKLQRPIKRPGIYGGKSMHAYYPASQEYGFLTKKKDGKGVEYQYGRSFTVNVGDIDDLRDYKQKFSGDDSRLLKLVRFSKKGTKISATETVQGFESTEVPGLHFMEEGAEKAAPQATAAMLETLEKELDKIWQEAQHT